MAKILIVEDEKQNGRLYKSWVKTRRIWSRYLLWWRTRIWKSFYRIDKSRNKETGGVGLGLAIAKSIANMNDVEIKLESKQGKGSTFTLIFAESLGY